MSPVLEARDVVAGYSPNLPILHGVSVYLNAGEIVSIHWKPFLYAFHEFQNPNS